MGLIKLWKKITYRTDDTTDYRTLEQRAGEVMPQWDTRSIPDAWPVEPPRQGFADEELRRVDPTWRPK